MKIASFRSNPVGRAFLLVASFAAAAVALADVLTPHTSPIMAPPANESMRRPVLVELFTSEGCSSCPPADALLARLDSQQFVPGVQAIVLSEHVTYWNRDGWTDSYSMDSLTERQADYRSRFGLESAYTPQAVIDGTAQVVGSDAGAVTRAVAHAAAELTLNLFIDDAALSGTAVHFKVRAGTVAEAADAEVRNVVLMAALAEDSAQTSVKSGENAGRTLKHVAVVRALQDMGKGALEGRDLALKLPNVVHSGPVRLVVFAADRHSGRILGVAEHTLTR